MKTVSITANDDGSYSVSNGEAAESMEGNDMAEGMPAENMEGESMEGMNTMQSLDEALEAARAMLEDQASNQEGDGFMSVVQDMQAMEG